MAQVVGLLHLSLDLLQDPLLHWVLLKCALSLCVDEYIFRYGMNMFCFRT